MMTEQLEYDRCMIESSGKALGIVVRERGGWVFYAAGPGFWKLDGRMFETIRDAENAANRLMHEQTTGDSSPV